MLNARFERFNAKVQSRKFYIEKALNNGDSRFLLVLVYSGEPPLGEEVTRDFTDLLKELNSPSEVVNVKILRQIDIHKMVAQGAASRTKFLS